MKIIDLIEDAETLRGALEKLAREHGYIDFDSEILDFIENSGKLKSVLKTAMKKYDSLDFDSAIEKSINKKLREENSSLKAEIEKFQKILESDSEEVSGLKLESVVYSDRR